MNFPLSAASVRLTLSRVNLRRHACGMPDRQANRRAAARRDWAVAGHSFTDDHVYCAAINRPGTETAVARSNAFKPSPWCLRPTRGLPSRTARSAKPRPWFRHYGCAGSDLTHACGHQKSPASAGLSFASRSPDRAANTGPFPRALFGASSAREHQHDDEAGGDNCGLQIQRQREVGGGTEELEEGGHYDPLLLPARSSSPARHDANYLSG